MKKPVVHVRSRVLETNPVCPSCGKTGLNSITGTFVDGPPDMHDLEGNHTVCGYCGAILVFSDNLGNLREPALMELLSVESQPFIMKLVQGVRDRIEKEKMGARFT